MQNNSTWHCGVLVILGLVSGRAFAAEPVRHIPDEYESTGGHSLALNNSGVATVGGLSAVQVNPAMLPLERQYRLGGGYHWPTSGREFYQAGVVDSRTSKVAAGVSYTGYTDDYVPEDEQEDGRNDSPIIRRGVLSLGQTLGSISAGISGEYIEAHPVRTSEVFGKETRVKGFGLGFGLAGLLTPTIRFGASAKNVSNKKIRDYAPTTYRAGAAYLLSAGRVSLSLDYRQRDRVTHFEQPLIDLDSPPSEDEILEKPEQMVLGAFTAQIYDVIRVLGSYGQSVSDERRSLSGGVALVSKSFTLSYSLARPYMDLAATHQAIELGVDMAM